MQAKNPILLVLLFCPLLPAAADSKCVYQFSHPHSTIMYHWQNSLGNRELLQQAGYDLQNDSNSQMANSKALLNESAMHLIRKWYDQEKGDAGGAGLYAAKGILDSKTYGEDLLLVEIVSNGKQWRPDDVPDHSGFKASSDAALAANSFSHLPWIANYYGDNQWFVIPRIPDHQEGIQIFIRPPTDDDVEHMASSILKPQTESTEKIISDLSAIAAYIFRDLSDPGIHLSARARIVFHRILFDHGYEWLLANEGKFAIEKSGLVESIYRAFYEVLPYDRRTAAIAKLIMEKIFLERGLAALKEKEILRIFARSVANLDPTIVSKGMTWLVNNLESTDAAMVVVPLMQLMTQNEPSEAFETFRNKFKPLVRDLLFSEELEVSEPSAQLLSLCENLYGIEFGELYEPLIFMLSFQNFSRGVQRSDKPFDELEARNIANALMAKGLEPEKIMSFTAKVLEKRIASNNELGTYDIERFVMGLMWAYSERQIDTQSINQTKEFLNSIEQQGNELNRRLSHFATMFYGHGTVVIGKHLSNATEYLKFCHFLAVNFPSFRKLVLRDIETAIDNPVKLWSDDQVLFLSNHKKWFTDLYKDTRNHLEEATRNFSHLTYFNQNKYMDLHTYTSMYYRSQENITGSRWHSEVSRLFSLVDPFFVFEDLRIMHAQWPMDRFDELYHAQGGTFVQKPWDSFLSAWDAFAAGYFPLQVPPLDNQAYPSIFLRKYVSLDSVHRKLLADSSRGYQIRDGSKQTIGIDPHIRF